MNSIITNKYEFCVTGKYDNKNPIDFEDLLKMYKFDTKIKRIFFSFGIWSNYLN